MTRSSERCEYVYTIAQAGICVAWCVFLLCFPLSRALEQIGGIAALALLVASYALYPQRAAVRNFPWRWLYAALLIYFLLNCALSINPSTSLDVLRNASHIGFLLFLSGLEMGRRPRFLRIFPWILAFLLFYQGVDGIWQSVTGIDPIHGTPILGTRLTAAFKGYRVGNLLGLALAASLALPFVMPQRWSTVKRAAVCALVWLPALYTCIFAQARSGYICLFVALVAFYALHKGLSWRWIVPVLIFVGCMTVFGFERVRVENALDDGRFIELWPLAWDMFLENPLFGSGVGTYLDMYQSLGVHLQFHSVDINHPHNIYLQLLCETGLVGFLLFCLFLGLTLWWGWRILRKTRQTASASADTRTIWKVSAACWSALIGYAAMAMFAHSFFRTWWLALAFSFLGIMAGGCLALQKKSAD